RHYNRHLPGHVRRPRPHLVSGTFAPDLRRSRRSAPIGGQPVQPWLAVDAVTGEVVVAFYDTRNDTTGSRYGTDFYLARSEDGGASFAADIRVSNATSNEHDCDGVFPCRGINYGNQQGDYAGVASYGAVAHTIWVDSRSNLEPISGCSRGIKMEEVFTAAVK